LPVLAYPLLCLVFVPEADDQARKPPEPPVNAVPAVPIPVGDACRMNRRVLHEWTPFGMTTRYAERGDHGLWWEWSAGRASGLRSLASFTSDESSRTWVITHWNPLHRRAVGAGVEHMFFLGDSWDARVAVEFTPRGPRLNARLTYWALEGVGFGLGVDSRGGVVLHSDRAYNDEDVVGWAFACYLRLVCLSDPVRRYLAEQRRFLADLADVLLVERR
jgi:hypothetical protein